MQQRYYDPVIGRFYSNDPVGFTTSNPMMFNRYAYANNNPYKYVNPDGQLGMLSTAFVGGLISGGLELGKQLYEGEVGKEFGKGALVGLGIADYGAYMAAASEGIGMSAIAKTVSEALGKATGAMAGSLGGDIAEKALDGEVSAKEQNTNMIANMVAPGSGDLAAAAVKTIVKSEAIATGS